MYILRQKDVDNLGSIKNIFCRISKSNLRKIFKIIIILLPIFIFLVSFTMGRYSVSVKELLHIFYAKIFGLEQFWNDTVDMVLFKIRLPRIIGAMIIGSSLSLAGATYQGLFKNPMISSDILGASAGAGFGAAIALLASFNLVGVQITAFAFGLGAVALTYTISKALGGGNTKIIVLVLTGMVVSAFFQALISIIKYIADTDTKLPAITFWLMGGLSTITFDQVWVLLVTFTIGIVPVVLLRWKLNIISFGDEEAKSMGINVEKVRIILIFCSTILTASSVAVGGIIGWVGLVIPHIARMIVGDNYNVLLPSSILIGSSYLLFVDDITRTIFSMEIPLGIITSLIGAPFFIAILLKGKKKLI